MNLPKHARGRDCQVRLPGCNGDPDTVVLCHLPGGGMGAKKPDLTAAFGCSACHDVIDGRVKIETLDNDAVRLYFLEGVIRTQEIWIAEGKLFW